MKVERILGDRVLVQLLDSRKTTRTGIVLPDRAESQQPRHGIVRSVGSLLTPDGKYEKCLRVDVGEIVLLPPGGKAGLEIDSDGELLWVYDSASVLAVLTETEYDRKEAGGGRFSPAGEVG